MSERSNVIAKLNDAFRTNGGRLYVTAGLVGRADLDIILTKVRLFHNFNEDNDPYGEHDFGNFEHAGEQMFWKIDYYDQELRNGSADPSNPAITSRVLTVMLASEY